MSRRLQRNTEAAISVYYNEFDPFAAAWLRALIDAGELPAGDVDERSITEVKADELRGYSQCHFFAGIGGWALALKWAGVPTDEPVWTGSCPCQPFSAAGKRKGTADERHLWPVFRQLIEDGKPPVVFGEQVASKDGRLWLSGVRADVEALGYAFGRADLCAAGIGSPHIRQRLFWVADAGCGRREVAVLERFDGRQANSERQAGVSGGCSAPSGVADAELQQPGPRVQGVEGQEGIWRHRPAIHRNAVWLGDSFFPRLEGHAGNGDDGDQSRRDGAGPGGPAPAAGG